MSNERILLESQGNGRLEGRLCRVESATRTAVVAPPHPLYGGCIDNPVVSEIEAGLQAGGFTTLAFNWRGVGRSEGAASGGSTEAVADYLGAAAWLAGEIAAPAAAGGYSFGAAAAVGAVAAGLAVDYLALVALPPSFLGDVDLASLGVSIHVVSGELDEIAPAGELARVLDPIESARLSVLAGTDHFFAGASIGRIRELLVPPAS